MVMALTLMSATMFVSCGSKEEEQVKWIPAPDFSGIHANLLDCKADSVKVILTKANDSDKSWEVRAMVPISNVMPWSEVPDTDESQSEYYTAKMGSLDGEFLDANGSPIDYDMKAESDKVETVLASENIISEDVWFKVAYSMDRGKYDKMKGIFDKVQGMEISRAELSQVHKATYTASSSNSSSKSSSYDDDDDDILEAYEDAYDKALDAYDKALDAATKASNVNGVKSAKEAVDAYKEALDAMDDWY